jgi:hypothetical protein
VLRRIFGPKNDEVTGEWRKMYSGEFHNSYTSSNIIRLIKSRRRSWVRHVAHMGEERKGSTGFWWESLYERDHSEDQGIVGRM